MLKCDNVSVRYRNVLALDRVSFEAKDGEYIAILGENGAGKSTLLKAILGLVPLAKGSIELDEKDGIGYLSQNTPVPNDFPASVYEIVLSGQIGKAGVFYTKNQKKTAREKMRIMGIENIANKSFSELSGGMKQRVLLARALCASDRLLILDEPVTGLDCAAREELYENLLMLKKSGMTIVMVTHDLNAALKYADKILHIGQHGNFFGTADEYMKSDYIKTFTEGNK